MSAHPPLTVTVSLSTAIEAQAALWAVVAHHRRVLEGSGGTEDKATAHARLESSLAAYDELRPAIDAARGELMRRRR